MPKMPLPTIEATTRAVAEVKPKMRGEFPSGAGIGARNILEASALRHP